jgi:Arc/MetJ family transcription regulator
MADISEDPPVTELAIKPETRSPLETRVVLTIDTDLLQEAQRQIGASSPDAAIKEALQRLVAQERAKRLAALERQQRMSDEGVFDYYTQTEGDR